MHLGVARERAGGWQRRFDDVETDTNAATRRREGT